MKQKFYIILAALVIIAGAVAGYFALNSSPQIQQAKNQIGDNENSAIKTFILDAENFSFSPSEIKVKMGDTVKIILNNKEGFHDWVVDEFSARTEKVQGPAIVQTQFVANKTGTFEFYCSVGTHRQMGMKGNLIVE